MLDFMATWGNEWNIYDYLKLFHYGGSLTCGHSARPLCPETQLPAEEVGLFTCESAAGVLLYDLHQQSR